MGNRFVSESYERRRTVILMSKTACSVVSVQVCRRVLSSLAGLCKRCMCESVLVQEYASYKRFESDERRGSVQIGPFSLFCLHTISSFQKRALSR